MRRCLALAAVLPLLLMVGCGGLQLSTSDVAYGVQRGSTVAVNAGLKALSRDATSYQNVKKAATAAKDAIEGVCIPLLDGASTSTLTMTTVNQVLAVLDGKLDPTTKGVIQLAINSVLTLVKLPDNPADKISADQRELLVALFQGMDNGLKLFLAWGGPDTRDIIVIQPVAHLTWTYGGKGP